MECPEQDSNLHASRHTHLKRARLPIPPPGHYQHLRAANETRTRDPDLGKVVLYQLSYCRRKISSPRSVMYQHFNRCLGNSSELRVQRYNIISKQKRESAKKIGQDMHFFVLSAPSGGLGEAFWPLPCPTLTARNDADGTPMARR